MLVGAVSVKQRSDPVISKPLHQGLYWSGDSVALNCTASPSRPESDITWLVNGKKVSPTVVT
jgi:CD80-like C2-set immunoglobulin domain